MTEPRAEMIVAKSAYDAVGGTPFILGIILTIVITIIITRYYTNKAAQTRALTWSPRGIVRIVTQPVTDVSRGLALTWNGDPLVTPYTVKLRISNGGSTAIRSDPKEYISPVLIDFGESKCYEALMTGTASGSAGANVIDDPCTRFEVKLPTLNRGAGVDLEMIVDGPFKYPTVTAELVGETSPITAVSGKSRRQVRAITTRVGLIAIVFLSFGFGLLGYQSAAFTDGPTIWPITIVGIAGCVLLLSAGVYLGSIALDRADKNMADRHALNQFFVR